MYTWVNSRVYKFWEGTLNNHMRSQEGRKGAVTSDQCTFLEEEEHSDYWKYKKERKMSQSPNQNNCGKLKYYIQNKILYLEFMKAVLEYIWYIGKLHNC